MLPKIIELCNGERSEWSSRPFAAREFYEPRTRWESTQSITARGAGNEKTSISMLARGYHGTKRVLLQPNCSFLSLSLTSSRF